MLVRRYNLYSCECPVPCVSKAMDLYLRELMMVAAAYALGCVSTGYYLVRLRQRDDIRSTSSGSTGAWNVGRLLGRRAYVITVTGDTAKGAVAVARYLGLEPWAVIAVGFAVVCGHVWPVQPACRGGKGLATTMGAVVVLNYWLVIAAFVIAGLAWLAFRHATASALIAVTLVPIVAAVSGQTHIVVLALVLLATVIVFTHRANLQALRGRRPLDPGEDA